MAGNGGFGRRGVSGGAAGAAGKASPPAEGEPGPAAGTGRSPLAIAMALVCGVIAFGGGAWLGREAITQLFTWRASAQMETNVAQLEKAARAKYPHLDPAEALSVYARETTPGYVAASKSERERNVKAAATFFGFYHINTRSRVEHCAALGVDIKGFARQVERLHRREYARAVAIATEAGMTEERLWGMVRSTLATMVRADMDTVARRLRTDPQGACRAVAERADEFADKLDFAALQPQVRRILLGS
jgi:hypothetical protein